MSIHVNPANGLFARLCESFQDRTSFCLFTRVSASCQYRKPSWNEARSSAGGVFPGEGLPAPRASDPFRPRFRSRRCCRFVLASNSEKKNKEHIKHSKYGSWHGIRRINNKHPGFKTGVERWMSEVRLWNLTDELRLRSSFFNLLLILNLAMCCLLKLSSGYGRRLMWNCASFKTPNVTT